jgi:Tfp pilus assembly protein PilW
LLIPTGEVKERKPDMKKLIVFVAVALAIPTSVALAKPPATHTNNSKAAPKVMYVLKGKLSGFTAATATTDGSISITVAHANYHGRALNGETLTFAVASNTKITNQNGKTQTTVADGTKGMVKFRAPLRVPATAGPLATALPTLAKAFHVIVNKATS